MEHIDGVKLSKLIRERRVTLRQAIKYITQILRGLKALHDNGWIHRDVNPKNILIEGDNIRLIDFGLAWLNGQKKEIGEITGTIGYVTPEHYGQEPAPARKNSDLYVVGLVLFEMLTQLNPMFGEDIPETIHNHVNKEVPALPSEAVEKRIPAERRISVSKPIKEVHEWLRSFIAKMTQKDPAKRFQSADEALNWLETTLKGYSSNSNPAPPSSRPAA